MRALPASAVNPKNQSAGTRYIRPVSSETATFTAPDPTEGPVSDPIEKQGEMKQVAGEAEYTFDVKQDRDGLQGALAITQQASGVITGIDTSVAEGMTGVYQVLTANDIPAGGNNYIGAIRTSPWTRRRWGGGSCCRAALTVCFYGNRPALAAVWVVSKLLVV